VSTSATEFDPVTDQRPQDRPWAAMRWPIPREVRLVGAAVTLTRFTPVDAPPLFAALDDDRVWAHMKGRPASSDDFAAALTAREQAGEAVWVVRLNRPLAGLDEGAVVGTTSLLDAVPAAARLEIGWTAYTRAVWGGPVNPSAKFLLLRYAFEELGAGRVQLKTDVRNHRSQRAIARLGAQHEGVLRRYQPRSDGTMRDTVMFAVIAEDWPTVSSGLQARLSS